MAAPNLLWISYPTYGPSGSETAAATYGFVSQDYKPPRRQRAISSDEVTNQNGTFKYVYDNGPTGLTWSPFSLVLLDRWEPYVGAYATQQWANLLSLWDHSAAKNLGAPDGTYEIHWGQASLEPKFETFPNSVGDKIEYRVVISIEEA